LITDTLIDDLGQEVYFCHDLYPMDDWESYLVQGPWKARRSPVGSPEKGDLFSTLRNAVFLAAIYVYWMGWLYAFYLYAHFGISLNVLDIPVYSFFVYAYSVAKLALSPLLTFFLLLLIYQVRRWLVVAILTFILGLGLFYILQTAAWRAANDEARSKRMGKHVKTITFVLRPESTKSYSKEFLCQNSREELKLLTETKTNYYVFYQPISEEGQELPYATTYDVLRSDIFLARIQMQNIPKKGELYDKSVEY